jgi:hypothetical protein
MTGTQLLAAACLSCVVLVSFVGNWATIATRDLPRDLPRDLRLDHPALRSAVWSATFGRPLRDGSGPGCGSDAGEAAQHAMIHLKTREELGTFLEARGAQTGVELGVQHGLFAESILTRWTSAKRYYLVDPWTQQKDYVDIANVDPVEQEERMEQTRTRLARFKDRVELLRAFSFDAVKTFDDCSLDFVYVDAVHDFQGALDDLVDWWPKVRPGGIMAGHDYYDGIIPQGIFGVKSAADRFGIAVNRFVVVTEDGSFWIVK